MRRVAQVTLALCLILSRRATAQSRPDSTATAALTLSAAIGRALQNNPDLRVARTLTDSARAELRIARAVPNPVFSTIPNSPFQYSASIPVDLGPQRWRRTAVARFGVEASRLDVRDGERVLVAGVARLFYDVLLADARSRLALSRRDVVRQLVTADSARVHAGDLPERALFRSQVELVKADADLARSAIDAMTARLALQGVMGVERPDSSLSLDGSLRYDSAATGPIDEALAAATGRRPDVLAARQREAQASAVQRLAAAAVIPVPQLSVVHQNAAPFDNGRYTALGLGIEVPIFTQYAGQRDRAAAGRAAAGAVLRRTEFQATREVVTARAEFLAQRALVERYEAGVIPRLEQNVEATRYAYQRGAASLLEVLDALRARQDVLADYNTALHDYWVSYFALRAATGLAAP